MGATNRPLRAPRPGAAAVLALAAGAAIALVPGPTAAAPGSPGTPQPATVLFAEDFENLDPADLPTAGVPDSGTHVMLDQYTGPPPMAMTYSADPQWIDLEQCNGVILSSLTAYPVDDVCGTAAWDALRGMSAAIAHVGGAPAAQTELNHSVAAWTANEPTGTGSLIFETVQQIDVAGGARFITFSVDAGAVACDTAQFLPNYEFFLDDGVTEIPLFTSPINPCTDPSAVFLDADDHAFLVRDTWAGRFAGNQALLFSGEDLRIVLRDASGEWLGNDAAFDNIRVLDATPQLDKAFAPEVVEVGQTSTLTLTVTNTDELSAKPGWSFVDTLPAGLEVAPSPAPATTCTNASVTATPGGSAIEVSGDLAAGQESCTVTVPVTSASEAVYVNGPGNLSGVVGLNPPTDAQVTFIGVVGVSFAQPAAAAGLAVVAVALLVGRRRRSRTGPA